MMNYGTIVFKTLIINVLILLMVCSFILSFGQQTSKQRINLTTYNNLVDDDWKGIDWEPFNRDWNSTETTSDGQQIADCGIKWARVWVTADMSFSRTDAMVNQCKAQNIKIICCYNKSNPTNDLGNSSQQDDQVTTLGKFIARYKNDIHYWEIQNEANLVGSWNLGKEVGRGTTDPNTPYNAGVHRFVQWLNLAYNTIKEVDSSATVVLGGLSSWIMEDFMDRLTIEQAYKYCDEIAYHPYDRFPSQCISRITAFKNKMATWPSPKNEMPIWITEIGFHTGSVGSTGQVSSEVQKGAYLREMMFLLIKNLKYSRPIFWYIFHEVDASSTYFSLVKKYWVGSEVKTDFLAAYYSYQGLNQNWNYYATIPELPAEATSNETIGNNSLIFNVVNPVLNKTLTIETQKYAIAQTFSVSLYNLTGSMVYHEIIYFNDSNRYSLGLNNIIPGVYIISLANKNNVNVQKVLIQQ